MTGLTENQRLTDKGPVSVMVLVLRAAGRKVVGSNPIRAMLDFFQP